MALEIKNIVKKFNDQYAVKELSLRIEDGEFFSLLGPSGCGKTTLLRMISGFETPDSGQILLDGVDLTHVPSNKRPFNMVFQSYALFPHLTVGENLAFGLKIKNYPKEEIKERVETALSLIHMLEYKNRLPETLSGGQSQRVAVARAFVNEPKVLLLDEPLSALDKKMRDHMQNELRALQKKLNITFIFVTHDQDEAMTMSDRIAIMEKGFLKQVSSPVEMYNSPSNSFTASFLGDMNLFMHSGQKVFIRPERTHVSVDSLDSDMMSFSGEVCNKVFKGVFWDVYVKLPDGTLAKCLVDSKNEDFMEELTIGRPVQVGYSQIFAHVFESHK